MKLKICLFTLFCLQSKLIGSANQAEDQWDSEPRSTQAELAEARKNQSQKVKFLLKPSSSGAGAAETEIPFIKNITQTVVKGPKLLKTEKLKV